MQRAGGDIVVLEPTDIEALGLGGPRIKATETSADTNHLRSGDRENLKWHNNQTGAKARINVGNMGMDTVVATPIASVSDSTFQDGLRVMVGHVGGESAASFNENFWKD